MRRVDGSDQRGQTQSSGRTFLGGGTTEDESFRTTGFGEMDREVEGFLCKVTDEDERLTHICSICRAGSRGRRLHT